MQCIAMMIKVVRLVSPNDFAKFWRTIAGFLVVVFLVSLVSLVID
jgi:hypothetical protein